ncbi:hypothetical protein J6590_050664 [Homalodisca vitripennis]|nr:hypothetical protein J6590_050664 [Homalodisca vitripennis]
MRKLIKTLKLLVDPKLAARSCVSANCPSQSSSPHIPRRPAITHLPTFLVITLLSVTVFTRRNCITCTIRLIRVACRCRYKLGDLLRGVAKRRQLATASSGVACTATRGDAQIE